MRKAMGFSLNINFGGSGGKHTGSVLPAVKYAPGTQKRVLIDSGDTATAAILPFFIGCMFGGFPAFMIVSGLHEGEGIFLKLFMGVFGCVGLAAIWMGIKQLILSMKFAPGRLAPSVWPLRLGDSFTMEYRRRSKSGAVADSFSARLYVLETAIYQCGTDTCTDTEEVLNTDLGMVGATQGGDGVYRGEWSVKIPSEGMSSFEAPRNKVHWMVEVKMFAAREEIDDSSFTLVVLPEIAPAKDSGQ